MSKSSCIARVVGVIVGLYFILYATHKTLNDYVNTNDVTEKHTATKHDSIRDMEDESDYPDIVEEEEEEEEAKAKPTRNKIPDFPAEFSYLESILRDCGELCDLSRTGEPGLFFDHIKAHINCQAIFKNHLIDIGHNLTEAPKEIPESLRKYYTLNERINVLEMYFSNIHLGGKALTPVWPEDMINDLVEQVRQGDIIGPYEDSHSLILGLKQTPGVKNGRVLVIGTEVPWVEACCLLVGAREVVTLEYGRIESHHPQLKTMTPDEFRKMYLNNTLGQFDAVVTYSSIEHSGLGRYGDALNPWGDILAVARAWCVTRDNGGLALAVEYFKNRDILYYNAHRLYGTIRYPYLVTNWNQVYAIPDKPQRTFVFKK